MIQEDLPLIHRMGRYFCMIADNEVRPIAVDENCWDKYFLYRVRYVVSISWSIYFRADSHHIGN